MQQYTNELTTEIIKSCAQPPFTPEKLATFDKSTQQELLNLITRLATCPAKLMFRIATVGSLTRNGGVLQKASGKNTAGGFQVARVMQGASAALVGSTLDNGDEIISTPQSTNQLVFREGDELPNGFLTMPGSKH